MVSYMPMRVSQAAATPSTLEAAATSFGNQAMSVVDAGVKIGEGALGIGLAVTGINVMKKTFTSLTGGDIPTNAEMSAQATRVRPKSAFTPT